MATQSYSFVQTVLPEVALDPTRLLALMGALLADRGSIMLRELWKEAGALSTVLDRQPPLGLVGELRRSGDMAVAAIALPPPREPPAPCAVAIVAHATWGDAPLPLAVTEPRLYLLEVGVDVERGGPAFFFAEQQLATRRRSRATLAAPKVTPAPPKSIAPDLRLVGEAAATAYATTAGLPPPVPETVPLQVPAWYWQHVGGAREAIVELIRAEGSDAIARVFDAQPMLVMPEIVGTIEAMGAIDHDAKTRMMFERVAQTVSRVHASLREAADYPSRLLALALVLAGDDQGIPRANLERALPFVFEARQRMTPNAPQFVQTLGAEGFVRRRLAEHGVTASANLTQAMHVLGAAVDAGTADPMLPQFQAELELVRTLLATVDPAAAAAMAQPPQQTARAAPPPASTQPAQPARTVRLKPPERRVGAYVIVREYTKPNDFAGPNLTRELEATLLDETIFGTDPSCAIEIKGAYISPQHCRIVRDGDRFILRDHSTNGTFVDGVGRMTERELAPGDWISIGLARVQFQLATPSRISVTFGSEPKQFLVLPDVVPIGRHPENVIQILDRTVAKHHGRITREGDRHIYRDLGSVNGTKLRGVKIVERLLEPGDELVIGGARLTYERGSSVETPMVALPPRPASSQPPAVPARGAPASPAWVSARASGPSSPAESAPDVLPPASWASPESVPPLSAIVPPEPARAASKLYAAQVPQVPQVQRTAVGVPLPPRVTGAKPKAQPTHDDAPTLRSSKPPADIATAPIERVPLEPATWESAPPRAASEVGDVTDPSVRPAWLVDETTNNDPPTWPVSRDPMPDLPALPRGARMSSSVASGELPALPPLRATPMPSQSQVPPGDLAEPQWMSLFLDEAELGGYRRVHDQRNTPPIEPAFLSHGGVRDGHVAWANPQAPTIGLAADHRWLFPSDHEASAYLSHLVPLSTEGLREIIAPPVDHDELRTFTGVRSGAGGPLTRIVCMFRIGRIVAKLEVVEGRQARATRQQLQPYHLVPLAERLVWRARSVLAR